MGQYYICVNLTKGEYLLPSSYNALNKLMEHSWMRNELLFTANFLLTPAQDWYKSKIVCAGDYMDEKIFLPGNIKNSEQTLNLQEKFSKRIIDLYKVLSSMYSRQTVAKTLEGCDKEEIKYILIGEFNKEFRFILNHDKKEFIDKLKCPVCSDGWPIHPLSLLTASGNGRSGGDFQGENKYVGAWAGDVI